MDNYINDKKLDVCRFLITNGIEFINERFAFTGGNILADEFEFCVETDEMIIDENILSIRDIDGYELAIFGDTGEIEIEEPDAEEYDELEDIKRRIKALEEEIKRVNNGLNFEPIKNTSFEDEVKRVKDLLNNYNWAFN